MRVLIFVRPSLPPGDYRCKLESVNAVDTEFGEGLRFVFVCAQGKMTDWTAVKTTGLVPSATNALGKLLSELAGGAKFDPNDEVDVDAFVGHEFMVTVGDEGIAEVAPVKSESK